MKNRFHLNWKYFQQKNPRAGALLSLVSASHLSFFTTSQNEIALQDIRFKEDASKLHGMYHAQSGAKKEFEKKLSALQLEGSTCLCVYGLGTGLGYLPLERWLHLNQERSLIFLEDDLSVILRFLETELATKLLLHPQVKIFYLEPGKKEERKEVIQGIAWGTFPRRVEITCLPYY